MKLMIDELPESYHKDLWMLEFVVSCLKIYGAPVSLADCVSFDDEIYHTFCAASLVLAMKEYGEELELLRWEEPEEAAYQFAQLYFQEKQDDLIPAFIGVGAEDYLRGEL